MMDAVRSNIASALLALSLGLAPVAAQTTAVQGAAPLGASERPVTRVLAIGTLTAKATTGDFRAVLAREVPATLKLYLEGKIADWYARPDQTGVVFLLNVTTLESAEVVLDSLPLRKAGMMTFELTPLGPLQPLGELLRPEPK